MNGWMIGRLIDRLIDLLSQSVHYSLRYIFTFDWHSQDTCILTWTPTEIGLFGAAFQIEDFINPSSTTPLSSIPLQFLFEVFLGDGSCAEAPTFDPVVLPGESCIAVPTGSTFTTRIEAVVSNPTRRYIYMHLFYD